MLAFGVLGVNGKRPELYLFELGVLHAASVVGGDGVEEPVAPGVVAEPLNSVGDDMSREQDAKTVVLFGSREVSEACLDFFGGHVTNSYLIVENDITIAGIRSNVKY